MVKKSKIGITVLPIIIINILWQREVGGVKWIHGGLGSIEIVKNMTNLLDEFHNIPINDQTNDHVIFDRIKRLDLHINEFSDMYIHNRKTNLVEIFAFTSNKMNNVLKEVREIESIYKTMLSICEKLNYFELWTLDFMENVKYVEDSIDLLQNVKTSYKVRGEKIFSIFANYIGYENNSKNTYVNEVVSKLQREGFPPVSIHQHFYSDYLELTILGIKDYLITKFSWTILFAYEGRDFKTEENNFIKEYQKRTSFLFNSLRALLIEEKTELSRSDPNKWEENINYDQLTRLVQGYIANEANLSPTGSCSAHCSDYSNTFTHTCSGDCCEKDKIEGTGKILSCESHSYGDYYGICPSEDLKRRYNHIHVISALSYFPNTYTYGESNTCPQKRVYIKSCNQGFYMCSACFCLIDDKSEKSDRFFNLREVLSDVEKNKVVTGVRFVKKNRIMHLQIQQGTLGPLGQIKPNTTEWKDVEAYKLEEKNNTIDYITFDNDQKSIDLDDVIDENPYSIVTGVKLSMVGTHLRLEVRTNHFKFDTGEIFFPKTASLWIYNTPMHGMKLPLKGLLPGRGPNVSTRAPRKSSPSLATYNYVEFTHSDKIDDVSQTTLPFIDTQDVAFHAPTPLSGVGLYHKGLEGYGGFLAPKIFSINFSAYI